MLQIKEEPNEMVDKCEVIMVRMSKHDDTVPSNQLVSAASEIGKIKPTLVNLFDFEASKRAVMEQAALAKSTQQKVSRKSIQQTTFECRICQKEFASRQNRFEHEQIHRTDRPHRCNLCDKTYKTKTHLNQHKKTHLEGNQFECQFCYKKSKTFAQLRKHERAKHKGELAACMFCDKKYVSSFDLITHIRRDHFDILRRQDRSTGDLNNLFQGIRTYECFRCGYSADSQRLWAHMAQCQYKYHECTVCKKQFKNNSSLRHHEKVHKRAQRMNASTDAGTGSSEKGVGAKRRATITWPFGVENSQTLPSVQTTLLTPFNQSAMGHGMFQCNQCPKKMGNRNELRLHQRIHNKFIECGQCNFKCSLNIQLLHHVRTKHKRSDPIKSGAQVAKGTDMECEIIVLD